MLFHGTRPKYFNVIMEEGFEVGKGGMFGKGIYFAKNSTKSLQYYKEEWNDKIQAMLEVKSLLLCEVLLGKKKYVSEALPRMTHEKIKAEGYDSIHAKAADGFLRNDEYIVYDADQVLPRYIIFC